MAPTSSPASFRTSSWLSSKSSSQDGLGGGLVRCLLCVLLGALWPFSVNAGIFLQCSTFFSSLFDSFLFFLILTEDVDVWGFLFVFV